MRESIRKKGVTTVSVGKDTARKLRAYAKDRPVYEVVDELVEEALSSNKQSSSFGITTDKERRINKLSNEANRLLVKLDPPKPEPWSYRQLIKLQVAAGDEQQLQRLVDKLGDFCLQKDMLRIKALENSPEYFQKDMGF